MPTEYDIIFEGGSKPGDGMRVTRVTSGAVEMLVQVNPAKWSKLTAKPKTVVVVPVPIEPPPVVITPPPVVITPPPVVIVPPPVIVPPAPVVGISPTQLAAALTVASGGAVLMLSGGEYTIPRSLKFATAVTLKSADPANPAKVKMLALNGTEGLTFDGIVFEYAFKAGDPEHTAMFEVVSSKRVTFNNCQILGSGDAGGIGWGRGLYIFQSEDIVLNKTKLSKFHRGLIVANSNRVKIVNNEFVAMRSDGMDIIQTNDILIENNYIHNFKSLVGSGDHPDAIQFWTTNCTKASTNIVIRGNNIDIGLGSYFQSIFMRNEEFDTGRQTFDVMAYENILIENNSIKAAHLHGITVGATKGMIVRNNTLIATPLSTSDPVNVEELAIFNAQHSVWIPRINTSPATTGAVIEGNVFGGAPWYTGSRIN